MQESLKNINKKSKKMIVIIVVIIMLLFGVICGYLIKQEKEKHISSREYLEREFPHIKPRFDHETDNDLDIMYNYIKTHLSRATYYAKEEYILTYTQKRINKEREVASKYGGYMMEYQNIIDSYDIFEKKVYNNCVKEYKTNIYGIRTARHLIGRIGKVVGDSLIDDYSEFCYGYDCDELLNRIINATDEYNNLLVQLTNYCLITDKNLLNELYNIQVKLSRLKGNVNPTYDVLD